MRETWYVLVDGTVADPNECVPNEAGDLVHSSGVHVAMRGDAHSSRSVDPDAERAKVVARQMEAGSTVEGGVELRPARPKRGYETREAKAD